MSDPLPRLRPELLRFPRDGGGLVLVDTMFDTAYPFDDADADALTAMPDHAPPDALLARLRAAQLLAGDDVDKQRMTRWYALNRPPLPANALPLAEGPWALAETLPSAVAPAWRQPERWRRLAEERIAGRQLLRLDGFVTDDAARAVRDAVDALPFEIKDDIVVTGEAWYGDPAAAPPLFAEFARDPLRSLLSAALGVDLPARIFGRAFRLMEGDRLSLHLDGLHYPATFSLGLCEDWAVARGGAIAFGVPKRDGFEVVERWLPHLGDLLLFQPSVTKWHHVEEVVAGTRYTLTGQYVNEAYPG